MWEKNVCSLLAGLVDPSLTFFACSSHHRSHLWMCQTNASLNASNLHQRIEWAPVMRRRHDTYWHLKSWVILTPLQSTEGPHSTLLCPRKDIFDNFTIFWNFYKCMCNSNHQPDPITADLAQCPSLAELPD